MKKRVLLPIVAIMTALILAACGGGDGPDNTVNNFMKEYKDLQLEEASKYVTEDLEEDLMSTVEEESEAELEDFTNAEGFEDFKANFKKLTAEMKYDIVEVIEEGETAEVKIDMTYADASEPLTESLGEILGQVFGMAFTMDQDATEEEVQKEMIEMVINTISGNLDNYETITAETSGVIKLTKEEEGWVITKIDEDLNNGLAFGLIEGMENYNPFSIDGEPIEEDIEFDFGDIEVNEDIDSTEVE